MPSVSAHGLGVVPDDTPIFCVLTRFGFRKARYLASTYRDHRRIAREVSEIDVPGLLRFAFLAENPTTAYTLSLWSARPQLTAISSEHLQAANRVFARLNFDAERGPEVWSTQWQLTDTGSNLRWDGLELRSMRDAGGENAER